MINRWLKSIRMKLVAAIAMSAAAAAFMAYAMLELAKSFYHVPLLNGFLSLLRRSMGVQALFILTVLVTFVLMIFLLSRQSIKYIEELSTGLKVMQNGNLDVRVRVRSNDELGQLAQAINNMVEKLKASMDEEWKAEETKKELITSISHDLRTPLTSVIGFLGLINEREKHSPKELDKYADIAYKKAIKLQSLIDELFEYTRVSYGRTSTDQEDINLNELLGQLAEEFYPVFQAAGVQCRLSVKQERLFVSGNGELLARLFENLLNNSVRYGAEGKIIDVVVKELDGFGAVDIINYGEPIPQASLQHIFEKFYRGESSRARTTGGTGLGLAIAKSIADQHKGFIRAESTLERTIFEVKLPLRKVKEKAAGENHES